MLASYKSKFSGGCVQVIEDEMWEMLTFSSSSVACVPCLLLMEYGTFNELNAYGA
jgi:hypothetical protein